MEVNGRWLPQTADLSASLEVFGATTPKCSEGAEIGDTAG
jgi:hypothetical protein